MLHQAHRHKKNWIDGKTPKDIINTVARIAKQNNASFMCVDVGWGVWLTMGLKDKHLNVLGINFSEKPTPERKSAKHYCATNASNMRAELHLDFQDLCENGKLEVTKAVMEKIGDVLPYIVSTRTASGKITIRPKPEIKAMIGKSPDEFDAVLLAIHAMILFLGGSSEPIT